MELTSKFVDDIKQLQRLLKQNGESISVDVQIDGKTHTSFSVNSHAVNTKFSIYSYNGDNQSVNQCGKDLASVLEKYTLRQKYWTGKLAKRIEEKKMVTDWHEPAGVRVSLYDVDDFIIANKLFSDCYTAIQNRTKIVSEDYDEYGSEYYLKIEGEFADLILEYKYGNSDFGGDQMECRVEPHSGFAIKEPCQPFVIFKDYENRLREFMSIHAKYIERTLDKTAKKLFVALPSPTNEAIIVDFDTALDQF